MIPDLKGQTFSVLGLGKSGIAASNFLAMAGADVIASDIRNKDELKGVINQLDPRVKMVSGTNQIRSGDEVIISPGISPHSKVFVDAHRQASAVVSEIELFYRFAGKPIIAITGTDGKSTVTALIAHILSSSGLRTQAAGNIGLPLCALLPTIDEYDVIVAEVSCFQLMTSPTFRANIAVYTNIAEDHLEYHGSFLAYQEAKQRLYRNQKAGDTIIINADDIYMKHWNLPAAAHIIYYSVKTSESPGLYFDGNDIIDHIETNPQTMCKWGDIPLQGRHNKENVLAAIAAARSFGLAPYQIVPGLTTFESLEHRLEFVRELDGIAYINDSKATNPHSAIAALDTFPTNLVLIAGGYDKGTNLEELAIKIRFVAHSVVVLGQTAQKLAAAIGENFPITFAKTLEEAVQAARRLAKTGDTILFSPACSSFDMFNSFEHRGSEFKRIVNELD